MTKYQQQTTSLIMSLGDAQVELYLEDSDWKVSKTSDEQDRESLIAIRGVAFELDSSELHEDVMINHRLKYPHQPLSISLTGHYGLIEIKQEDSQEHQILQVELHSDRLRSFPLFYACRDLKIWISDNMLWIGDQLNAEIEPLAEVSLWRTGQLVSGSDTLLSGVKQLRASERVSWDSGHLTMQDGELFVHQEEDVEADEVKDWLKEATRQFTERLITYANGAQIVVPLSGGFDSRLILTALVDAQYPDLLAFTYGREQSGEALISKQLAQQLGVPWHFVRYTPDQWKKWSQSSIGKELLFRARRAGVLVHVQDPIAVSELVKLGLVKSGYVAVYGHSGDVHAGSVIDYKSLNAPLSIAGYIDLLANKYFRFQANTSPTGSYQSAEDLDRQLRVKLERELSEPFRKQVNQELTREGLIDELERWFWRERCSKYLVHSMRVHEAYEARWWLPLWDDAFTRLWMRVPLKYRGREGIYHQYVDEYFYKVTGIQPPQAMVRALKTPPIPLYKRVLLRSRLVQVLRLRARHPFGWYALIPFMRHLTATHPEEHINILLIARELKWWKREVSRWTRSNRN